MNGGGLQCTTEPLPDVMQNEWDLCVPLGWGCLPQDMLLTRKSSGWEMVMVTLHAHVCVCVCVHVCGPVFGRKHQKLTAVVIFGEWNGDHLCSPYTSCVVGTFYTNLYSHIICVTLHKGKSYAKNNMHSTEHLCVCLSGYLGCV